MGAPGRKLAVCAAFALGSLSLAACSLRLAPGGGADGGEEESPCVPAPAGLEPARLAAAGCPALDGAGLVHLRIDSECELNTNVCAFDCLPRGEPRGCFVEDVLGDGPSCVVVLASFVLEAELDVTGSAPLVVLATGHVALSGLLNASASGLVPGPGGFRGGELGRPGGGPSPGVAGEGTGGGGGGANLGPGGRGGCETGGAGGAPLSRSGPALVVGGSGGGGTTGRAGGAGGGVVWLFSGESVRVAAGGAIRVDGSAGRQQDQQPTPAGGGGSGGAIVLEAPLVLLEGRYSARGGSGGGVRSDGSWVGAGLRADLVTAGGDGDCVSTVGAGGGGGSGRVLVRADLFESSGLSTPLGALGPPEPFEGRCP